MDFADTVLEHLSDWWAEAWLAEPKVIFRPSATGFGSGGPVDQVEAFAFKRENLLAALRPIRQRMRRLKARLRHVYRLHYLEGLPYPEVAKRLEPEAGVRSVRRYVEQIRACAAGTLRKMSPGKMAVLRQLIAAQARREEGA